MLGTLPVHCLKSIQVHTCSRLNEGAFYNTE